jgi:hypothetical protein
MSRFTTVMAYAERLGSVRVGGGGVPFAVQLSSSKSDSSSSEVESRRRLEDYQ